MGRKGKTECWLHQYTKLVKMKTNESSHVLLHLSLFSLLSRRISTRFANFLSEKRGYLSVPYMRRTIWLAGYNALPTAV
uniref:Uncharacterized protein n=1 Tax=Ditylenchus dipsaci TaxID=166011 RepID=A0A915DS82_9BILA